ncbi:MAG TPA: geranylgeranyl reductase family protein [bacterium]|nr:geranylgeranyl reductase family protein [bacterium]
MKVYDVLVVGAGPAGASVAYELARRKRSVLILEKAKLPRYKTCGGAIPFNFFTTLPERVQKTLDRMLPPCLYFGPEGQSFTPQYGSEIAGVMRDRFDHACVLSAADYGAEWVDENRVLSLTEDEDQVLVDTKRGKFAARFLVGADGAMGFVKRQLKLGARNRVAAALEMEVPRKDGRKGFHADLTRIHFTLIQDGYAWVFPKAEVDSVGILSFNRDRQKVRQILSEWVAFCGYDPSKAVIHGHPIPVWKQRIKLSTPRALLVGDAANTVDPLAGEGIRYGILSGRIAARYLEEAMIRQSHIQPEYTKTVYEEIHRDFQYAKWLAMLVYRFPKFFYRMWVCTPQATNLLGQVLYGELRYRDLFQRAMASFARLKTYRRFFPGLSH